MCIKASDAHNFNFIYLNVVFGFVKDCFIYTSTISFYFEVSENANTQQLA